MVAGTIEKIQVVLQAVTAGFSKGLAKAQTQLRTVGKQMNSFGAVMKMPIKNFKELAPVMANVGNTGQKLGTKLRMATHGMRGFRMEMLGVMFFGMMLQKTFSGLIQTSLEWMGVMDVFSVALGILFLPVAELLLGWALKFLNWVSDLTPKQKKLISTFVLLGLAIGGVLFIIGSFALGIGSLILAFGGGGAALVGFSGGLGGVGTAAAGNAVKVGKLTTALKNLAGVAAVAISISLIFSAMSEGDAASALAKIFGQRKFNPK